MTDPFEGIFRRTAKAPGPKETFGTLDRSAGDRAERREKTGRTAQFNIRVHPQYKQRAKWHAKRERVSDGAIFEAMLRDFEAAGAAVEDGVVPAADLRAGRTRKLVLWTSEEVAIAIGKVAAHHKISVSHLIEDLLAFEVARLEQQNVKFGVAVKKR